MVDAAIMTSVLAYLKKLSEAGFNIRFAVIFGSYVSGKNTQFSDIDLMVVSPDFDNMISRESVNKLWRIAARTDSRIEPIPCGQSQWASDVSTPIIEIARIEGQIIPFAA